MNVLFLTHRLPYAPNRGDRIRAYYLLRELSRFADVSLFSLVHDDEEAARAEDMPLASRVATARVPWLANRLRGAARLASTRPLTHSLLDAPDAMARLTGLVAAARPDVVLAYCSGMARFAMAPPLDGMPFVLDMVDVDSAKWAALAERAAWPRGWIYRREATTLAAFERAAARRARSVLVVSEREREALLAIAPDANVIVVPNGVDLDAFTPPGPPAAEPVVVFCGVMDYEPNVEGVTWFVREVWPRVKAARPDARFVIVGSSPTRAVLALAEGDPSIEVTGRVESVQPYLWKAAVSVAPLQTARGLQNKALEALAAGLPVVATPAVVEGLPADVHPACAVAGGPDAFGAEVVTLLGRAPGERRSRAETARLTPLSWPAQLAKLAVVLGRAP